MDNQKNEIVTVTVENLGMNGEGIARINGKPIFVPFTLPGEQITVKIIKKDKQFYIGKLENILIKSKDRVIAPCKVFGKCGGCQLQHLAYEKTLQFKTDLVTETLLKVGNISFPVSPCVNSKESYHYRNKISLPIREINGEIKIGFFSEHSHRIIEVENCPLQQTLTDKIILVFKNFLLQYPISAYNDETKKGLIKHLVAREFNGKILIAVVINGNDMLYSKELYQALQREFGEVTLYLNHNIFHNNVILGEKSTLIGGDEFLVEELGGIIVKTGVLSFMQVNQDIRDKLYQAVLNQVKKIQPKVVIDAYSGAGLLTGILAKNSLAKVFGLEIVKEAVDASEQLLKDNQLEKRAEIILGDCVVTLPKVMSENREKTTLIVDPPRKGLELPILHAILESKPEQIIYIACGLTSLARDLSYLLNTKEIKTGKNTQNREALYEIINVTPYDMFPQTKHVETVVELRVKETIK